MKTVRLLTLTSLFAASTALAHTMNVLPSHYVQSKTGGFVTVDLFASKLLANYLHSLMNKMMSPFQNKRESAFWSTNASGKTSHSS